MVFRPIHTTQEWIEDTGVKGHIARISGGTPKMPKHPTVPWVFSTVETGQQADNSPEFLKTIIWGLKNGKRESSQACVGEEK